MFRSLALLACIPVTAIAFPQIPAKPEDKKDMAPKEETKPDDIDVHKTAERIAENAQKAGDRLKDKDPGADTRKIQKDILNDIDALIKKALQPPPPPMSSDMNPMMPPPPMGGGGMGGGMSGGMPPKPTGGMGNSGQQSPMPMGGTSGNSKSKPGGGSGSTGRRRRERKPHGGPPMSTREPMAKAGPDGKEPRPAKLEPKEVGSGGGDKTDFGGGFGKSNSKRERDKLADLYKDVWGQLPERMRQEMDLYYREQFMPRYSELLRRYYAALAEQKKKGSENR